MAGKSRYTEADEARVYLALAVAGSVKGAARETGVPETTVRRMKEKFDKHGPPKQEVVETAVGDFVSTIETVEWKALKALEKKIDEGGGNVRELATVFGILNDKRTRASGLADQTVEHRHTLPSADEVKALLQGLSLGAVEASRQRQSELSETGLREQAPLALPAPRP